MSTTTASLKLTKPDVNDKVEDTIAALAANFDLLDALLPIGRVIEFATDYDPNAHAPFSSMTWTRFAEGRTTVGAGTDFPLGTTGGSATHKLTASELPANIPFSGVNDGTTVTDEMGNYYPKIYQDKKSNWQGNFAVRGGGQAMSIMDPYIADNKWVRTA